MHFLTNASLFIMATLALSLPVSAHDSDDGLAPDEKRAAHAIKTRQAIFTLMGSNMGPLGGMARGNVPFDAELVGKNATRIAQLADMVTDSFKLDTSESSIASESLDNIWDELENFEKKVAANQAAAKELIAVASTGNEGDTKKAIGALGKTCGSCHDDYRVED